MFASGSERAAVLDSEIVHIRPLQQDDDDNDIFVPLYARDLTVFIVKAVRLVWLVANAVPDETNYQLPLDDEERDTPALRHLITIYMDVHARLRETRHLRRRRRQTCRAKLLRRLLALFESWIFLPTISRGHPTTPIKSVAQRACHPSATRRASLCTIRPHSINRFAPLAIDIKDAAAFSRQTQRFVRRYVDIIPGALIYGQTKETI